ncbi:winged helix-turn-helix domain-containing protein [Thiohalobacter thiocyanaticus]|uniref:ArsR family transcriptional regulator n=1 Tax=Thiohalobacter thiocyanaticus TaxID=585455 RepID=A0A426QJM6_9GAMM|nr:winged helix-turn-helix domain-containing protein [Thiohalobacter thiocyanaticus]RRQ21907.1 ArsR family transcriptional regulator [Thiohalobacter thiocyanaticus]
MMEWTKTPTAWITKDLSLTYLRWHGQDKVANIAGLMLYTAIAQNTNREPTMEFHEPGWAKLSYTQLSELANISRATVSRGLSLLTELEIIKRDSIGNRHVYGVTNYSTHSGWGKLPAKGMYNQGLNRILAFQHFHLRSKVELNALKIFYLIVALRNDQDNLARASYEKIHEYTGVATNDVKAALSLLVTQSLIRVEHIQSNINPLASAHAYRLNHLYNRKHMGTTNAL